MQVPIIMPQLGESIAEATVTNLLVQAGDVVKADQDVLEVETNKATMNVTSPGPGRVQTFLVKLNESYPFGTVLGYIEVSADDAERLGFDGPEDPASAGSATGSPAAKPAKPDAPPEKVQPTVRGLPVPAQVAGASYM